MDPELLELGVAVIHNEAGFTLADLQVVNRPLDQVCDLILIFFYLFSYLFHLGASHFLLLRPLPPP